MYNNHHFMVGAMQRLGLFLAIMSVSVGLWGCDTTSKPPAPTETVTASEKARVRFKGNLRLLNTLSQGLSIEKEGLCKELGLYDCLKEAHSIVLGGVEPYRLSIRTSWGQPPVIAPIAMDRVALASCGERAKRDFASPDKAVIFKALAQAPAGSKESMEAGITELYKKLLLRMPTAQEKEYLVAFWDKVKAKSQQPAQDWAALVCFGVVTSSEFLFY